VTNVELIFKVNMSGIVEVLKK